MAVAYSFRCPSHGTFTSRYPMGQAPKDASCPDCGNVSPRDYKADLTPVIWKTQGAHNTDYDRHGDKLERLNRTWSEATGESPPPPARDVPRSGDKY